MSPAKKDRRRLEEFPPLMTLPQVGEFLGRSQSFCREHLEHGEDGSVLRIGNQVLPVFRQGRSWCAWRAELADMVGEKTG